ncbi:MAG: hypothetical protein A3F17_05370 [Gammaproteobacteria bacterium RIFCSPHIGHO2_12_FULL_41_15]|nr:MAG: hypothetical protein A3F17_05370 [Gammaproteobacteria bacterium RIFCSPHIGHO2_12_FULL_41_15]
MATTDDRKISPDEEYQYPKEEYVTEVTPSPPSEPPEHKSRWQMLLNWMQNNKRVTVVVVLIAVVLIAFEFMTPSNKIKPVSTEPVAVQPTVPVPPNPQVVDQLNTLNSDAQTNQAAINQLQSQIEDLRSQVAQANASQAQLSQSLTLLTEQIKDLTTKLHPSKTATAFKVPVPAPIVFHLRAIVPGRAWIVSSDGLSESVSVGDSVPQYGTVQTVDANRGLVLTSSGKVITYGVNDH